MTVDEFWDSNPWELRVASDGYSERIRDTQEIHAGLIASLMNVTQQLKNPKRFTVSKLIGHRKSGNRIYREAGESKESFRKRIADLKENAKDGTVW